MTLHAVQDALAFIVNWVISFWDPPPPPQNTPFIAHNAVTSNSLVMSTASLSRENTLQGRVDLFTSTLDPLVISLAIQRITARSLRPHTLLQAHQLWNGIAYLGTSDPQGFRNAIAQLSGNSQHALLYAMVNQERSQSERETERAFDSSWGMQAYLSTFLHRGTHFDRINAAVSYIVHQLTEAMRFTYPLQSYHIYYQQHCPLPPLDQLVVAFAIQAIFLGSNTPSSFAEIRRQWQRLQLLPGTELKNALNNLTGEAEIALIYAMMHASGEQDTWVSQLMFLPPPSAKILGNFRTGNLFLHHYVKVGLDHIIQQLMLAEWMTTLKKVHDYYVIHFPREPTRIARDV